MAMKLVRFGGALLALAFSCVGTSAERSEKMLESVVQLPAPVEGMAQVVFVRKEPIGRGVQSTLYAMDDIEPRFLGILSNGTRMAIDVDPGVHRFMVYGGRAEFIDVETLEGRIYYILVQPVRGNFKARFLPLPVKSDPDAELSTRSASFKRKLACTVRVESTADAEAWFLAKQEEIRDKTAKHLAKWKRKDASKRSANALRAEDGVQLAAGVRSTRTSQQSLGEMAPCADRSADCPSSTRQSGSIGQRGEHGIKTRACSP